MTTPISWRHWEILWLSPLEDSEALQIVSWW